MSPAQQYKNDIAVLEGILADRKEMLRVLEENREQLLTQIKDDYEHKGGYVPEEGTMITDQSVVEELENSLGRELDVIEQSITQAKKEIEVLTQKIEAQKA